MLYMTPCKVKGCKRQVDARNWCNKHYQRWYLYGNPTKGGPFRLRGESIETQFWVKVKKTKTCWLWTGHISYKGYGKFRSNKGIEGAHRFSYKLLIGKIPKWKTLDHLCRIRHCVNPTHLE